MNLSSYIILENPSDIAVLDATDVGEYTEINRINVPPLHRGKGYGSKLLKEVCQKADEFGIELRLSINPYGELTYEQLLAWYERYGFEFFSKEEYLVRHFQK